MAVSGKRRRRGRAAKGRKIVQCRSAAVGGVDIRLANKFEDALGDGGLGLGLGLWLGVCGCGCGCGCGVWGWVWVLGLGLGLGTGPSPGPVLGLVQIGFILFVWMFALGGETKDGVLGTDVRCVAESPLCFESSSSEHETVRFL